MPLWNYLRPVSASVLFHGAIVAFLLVGWESAPARDPVDPPRYIKAKLVQLKPQAQQTATKPEEVQKVDLAEQRRQQELARQRAAEQEAREQRAKEQRAKERRAQEKREEAERQRQEEQRQRELAAQREARQAEAFREALQEEKGLIMEDVYATKATSYMDVIARRIERHWNRPASARNGMEALLAIQLVPTGRVVSVSIVEGSGDAAFDRSAEQAVRQVEVFPVIKDMSPEVFERYYRRFNLLFKPQDLRQ